MISSLREGKLPVKVRKLSQKLPSSRIALFVLCVTFCTQGFLFLSPAWPLGKFKAETLTRSRARKAADGCYHVYLDDGSNIGVHNRFLFEPKLYPNATTAHQIFDTEFGSPSQRDNRDLCAFGFEPNPSHQKRHKSLETYYADKDWRYHPIMAATGDMHIEILIFYHNSGDKGRMWSRRQGKLYSFHD